MLNFSVLRKILQILVVVLLTSAFVFTSPKSEIVVNQNGLTEEELSYAMNQYELQKQFEKDVEHSLRLQNDLERSMSIDALALQSKKKLTKKERKSEIFRFFLLKVNNSLLSWRVFLTF